MTHSHLTSLPIQQARRLLAHNAIFTGACALLMIFFGGAIGRAVLVAHSGSLIVSVIWVLVMGILLLATPTAFTPAGQALTAVIAVLVGWFGRRQLLLGRGL